MAQKCKERASFQRRNKCCNSVVGKHSTYTNYREMGTFFVRCAIVAVALAGCSGRSATPGPRPAAHVDTIDIPIPVFRVTPNDSAGAAQLDSATLALIERRVLSRVSSILRAHTEMVAGKQTAGIPPVKGAAPLIRHGLLGTITFNEDGTIAEASRDRIAAIASMLDQIEGPLELRSRAELGSANIDVAIARTRRVYVELIAHNESLAERDVALTITGVHTLHPINPEVEIFYRTNDPGS